MIDILIDILISSNQKSCKIENISRSVIRLRSLCVELYKTITKPNPFKLWLAKRPAHEKYKIYLIFPEFNQISYGRKSFGIFGPKLWSSKLYPIKSSENVESFKEQLIIGMKNAVSVRFVIAVNISF